jgi:hypothetical protein
MEKLILDALVARSGGDVIAGKGRYREFRLPNGVHHLATVALELAQANGAFVQPPPRETFGFTIEQRGYIERRWLEAFYRAWRHLADRGLIECPQLIQDVINGRAVRFTDGSYLPPPKRSRRQYAKLSENALERFFGQSASARNVPRMRHSDAGCAPCSQAMLRRVPQGGAGEA